VDSREIIETMNSPHKIMQEFFKQKYRVQGKLYQVKSLYLFYFNLILGIMVLFLVALRGLTTGWSLEYTLLATLPLLFFSLTILLAIKGNLVFAVNIFVTSAVIRVIQMMIMEDETSVFITTLILQNLWPAFFYIKKYQIVTILITSLAAFPIKIFVLNNDFSGNEFFYISQVISITSSIIIAYILARVVNSRILNEQALEEEIIIRKQKETEADQANIAKSEFLANISHEIRTPLTAIQGFSELLMDGSNLSKNEHHQFLKSIHSSNRHLLTLIDDILELARIEANMTSPKFSTFLVVDLCAFIQRQFEDRARHKNLDFIFECASKSAAPVNGDLNKIKLIAVKIIDNAVKFTEKGSVKISIDQRAAYRHDSKKNGYIQILVEDSGIGIDESELEKISNRFYQVEPHLTKKYGGAGLGLSIAYRLTELLDGKLAIESTRGAGTSVTVTVPVDIEM
jgi:signal transduction histidine kinase